MNKISSELQAGDFDFPLDERLIAQQPLDRRDQSRLLVLQRTGGLSHRLFIELPELLRDGDLLVLNDTAVIPAKFVCRRASGARIEGLFIREVQTGTWLALLKNAQKVRDGEWLELEGEGGHRLATRRDLGKGQYELAVEPALAAMEILQRVGTTPLPPYIRRAGNSQDDADRGRYQTIYAQTPGAVAAPTAGLHFTPQLMERLAARGVQTARLTLHVGMGTFLPVKSESLSQHTMHSEWYDLPAATADALNRARREGRRVVAVGTTCVRVLETVAALQQLPPLSLQKQGTVSNGGTVPKECFGEFQPARGQTEIFIFPPYRFRAVDALVTNFHLPRSTLLMLVSAFAAPGERSGIAAMLSAYREAIRQEYRFFSYGDAMLIE